MKATAIRYIQLRIQQCKQKTGCIRGWLNHKFHSKTPQPIADNELLARFVLYRDHIRANKTVKPDAFIPHPHTDLSVTRHKGFSDNQLWNVGRDVATARKVTLYGRADVSVATVRQQSLAVEPQPVKGNPNHANILGWPKDKPAQKIIAQELAAAAIYHSKPTQSL
jgi:hypothetical protein